MRARDVGQPFAVGVSAVGFVRELRDAGDRLLHSLPRQRQHRPHHEIAGPAHAMLELRRNFLWHRLAQLIRKQGFDCRLRIALDEHAERRAPRLNERQPRWHHRLLLSFRRGGVAGRPSVKTLQRCRHLARR